MLPDQLSQFDRNRGKQVNVADSWVKSVTSTSGRTAQDSYVVIGVLLMTFVSKCEEFPRSNGAVELISFSSLSTRRLSRAKAVSRISFAMFSSHCVVDSQVECV